MRNRQISGSTQVKSSLEIFRFDLAINGIFKQISQLDQLINREKPWEKEGEELRKIIEPVAEEVFQIGYGLLPFMPETSDKILKQFTGLVKSGDPLFPRL